MREILSVNGLRVLVGETVVVENAKLSVGEGEKVLLLGPNGSGKTSLAMALLGHPKYSIVGGEIKFYGKDITKLNMERRVALGLTATFQFPPEIRGVTLRELAWEIAKHCAVPKRIFEEFVSILKIDYLLDREVNVGFSGGEKRRTEIFLTALQMPKFVIFDEPDSGVDIESIELIGKAINKMFDFGLKGAMIITHTGKLAEYIRANRAYVMVKRKIACSGPPTLIFDHIEKYGFEMCRVKGGSYVR